jgi:hypothetical protein
MNSLVRNTLAAATFAALCVGSAGAQDNAAPAQAGPPQLAKQMLTARDGGSLESRFERMGERRCAAGALHAERRKRLAVACGQRDLREPVRLLFSPKTAVARPSRSLIGSCMTFLEI